MFGIEHSVWRGGLLIALVLGGLVAWYRGERHLRGITPAKGWESLTQTAVMLWRTVMFTLGAVAIVAAIGLWWAQDAGDRSAEASRSATASAEAAAATSRALCRNTLGWQESALSNREADVRIVESELGIARDELADAELLLDEALTLVAADEQITPTEDFFVAGFTRDVERADSKVEELEAERVRRQRSADELEGVALEECPPEPVPAMPPDS
jgi:hypothetical protein